MNKKILVPLIAISLLAVSCNQQSTVGLYQGGTVQLDGASLAVDVATTFDQRNLGLGGRSSIDESEGMWFEFDNPARYQFWMKGMEFPIDIIWIGNNQVVDITQNAEPQPGIADAQLITYTPSDPVDHVLEVKAGWAERHGVAIGDSVSFTAK